jgi:hypothetical protein
MFFVLRFRGGRHVCNAERCRCQVARSLRTQKIGVIGVVVPDLAHPFFASIARSITLASESDGYSVIVADSVLFPMKNVWQDFVNH